MLRRSRCALIFLLNILVGFVVKYRKQRKIKGNGQKREYPVLFGQKRMYLKTKVAEIVLLAVSDWPTPAISRFWPKATGYSR